MKTKSLLRPLALAGALTLSAAFGRAQLLTESTLSGFDAAAAYGAGQNMLSSSGFTQTFSGISSITDLSFRFLANDFDTFSSTALTVYLSEWSGSNSNGNEIGQTTLNIVDSTSWTSAGSGFNYFDADLDLSSFATSLTPATTYGLTIVGNPDSSSNYRLGGTSSDSYTGGSSFMHNGVPTFSALTASGTGVGNDFLFYGAVSPVPEASSIAVLFAGAFVGGMMLRRSRYRRPALADTSANT